MEDLTKEKEELKAKIDKLDTFRSSEQFKALSDVQKTLLKVQFAAMMSYHECLVARLNH